MTRSETLQPPASTVHLNLPRLYTRRRVKGGVCPTKDRFDRISEEGAHSDDDADRVLDFLIQNEDKAYTKSELAEKMDLDRERVGPLLDRLKERGSVKHRSDYWRVTDHELAVRAGTALTAETARQHDGGESFDVEKWAEYAVDEVDLNRGENE